MPAEFGVFVEGAFIGCWSPHSCRTKQIPGFKSLQKLVGSEETQPLNQPKSSKNLRNRMARNAWIGEKFLRYKNRSNGPGASKTGAPSGARAHQVKAPRRWATIFSGTYDPETTQKKNLGAFTPQILRPYHPPRVAHLHLPRFCVSHVAYKWLRNASNVKRKNRSGTRCRMIGFSSKHNKPSD